MRHRTRRGFSLVELIVSMAIGLIIAAGVMWMLTSQIQLSATQNRNILNQEELRETLYFVTEEVRAMGSGAIEPYVTIATPEQLEYVGDLDGDPLPDRVNYVLTDGNLERMVWNSPDGGLTWNELGDDTLLDNVGSGAFSYFAYGNDVTDVPADISSIELALALDVTENTTTFNNGKVAEQEMITRITIRNRLPHMNP